MPPGDASQVTSWADKVLAEFAIRKDISITSAQEKLYLIKYKSGGNEIYFFSNQDEENDQNFTATFSNRGKTAWCWDPHTGDRFILPNQDKGEINIRLQALESMLILLEESGKGVQNHRFYPDESSGKSIGKQWQMEFDPIRDEDFSLSTGRLFEFGNHGDPRISTFAGQVSYQTTFELEETDWTFIDLGIQKHITEVKLNGEKLGVRWWGRHLYQVAPGLLKEGKNQLEIIYTTTLANYANSLTGNEVAMQWINLEEPDHIGLTGDIRLLKSME